MCKLHYTPVLPVLFLSGGRHLLQDVTPVGVKPGYLERQYSQDAPVSEPAKPGDNVKSPPFSEGRSSDSFGGPWTASYPGSLGKRWSLGPR